MKVATRGRGRIIKTESKLARNLSMPEECMSSVSFSFRFTKLSFSDYQTSTTSAAILINNGSDRRTRQ